MQKSTKRNKNKSVRKQFHPDLLWDAYYKALSQYNKMPGLSGIDIGLKYESGNRTERPCIRFHLTAKKSSAELRRLKMVAIPKTIGKIPTDILEGNYKKTWSQPGYYKFNPKRIARFQTLQPGISMGDDYDSCGTLGLIVRDRDNGNLYALTAAHVLPGRPGEDIFQPAAIDSQQLNPQPIGKIMRKYLPLDVGLVKLNQNVALRPEQFESNVLVETAPDLTEFTSLALLGKRVFKSGRTTGLTTAIIDGIGKFEVEYAVSLVPENGNANNIEISYSGDSGAVWYDQTNRAIGVQVIGENNPHPSKERAVAVAMPAVMHYLNIDFIK